MTRHGRHEHDGHPASDRTGDRSLNVTFTATRTFAANSVVPGALDRLLGETGYESQFAEETVPARESSAQERLRHSVLEPVARRTSDAGRLVLGRAPKRLM